MSVCVVIQSLGTVATGSDVTPDSVNWTNISSYLGVGSTNSQTISSIDTPITIRAAWGTNGDANLGRWIVNGAAQPYGSSPQEVTVSNNTTLTFQMRLQGATTASSNGTVTVTNQSDGAASLDTFTYYLEQGEL